MDGDGKNISLKMQRYLNKIPTGTHCHLEDCIESEQELCDIAEKLTDWESKYGLLDLTFTESKDICKKESDPKLQR